MADNQTTQPTSAAPSFEQALAKLESIVHGLEDGELGLAEALGSYEEGVKLLKQCYGLLERAERRIELLSGVDAEGNPVTQPFDDESSLSLDEKAQSRSQRRTSPGARSAKKTPKTSDEPSTEIDERKGLF